MPWFKSLMFWGSIDFEFQGQIWLDISNFLASPLLEIHNHHITNKRAMSTCTASQVWLFQVLHPLQVLNLHLDCFMVPTVLQSQHFACILIWQLRVLQRLRSLLYFISYFTITDFVLWWSSGGHLSIKISSYWYRDTHYKDKTVSWVSYLYNGNPHTYKDKQAQDLVK